MELKLLEFLCSSQAPELIFLSKLSEDLANRWGNSIENKNILMFPNHPSYQND
jgi:hypothetical protein